MQAHVYAHAPLPFSLKDLPDRQEPDRVLLCSPDYFDIVDEKNVHMQGNIGSTDRQAMQAQWNSLKAAYDQLARQGVIREVSVQPGAPGCEDMVFCANQTLPWQGAGGEKLVVMSRMRHASRQREVAHFQRFFEGKGFQPLHLSSDVSFEGMGDVIPHPHKRLLYGGYGHRTHPAAYEELAQLLDSPVIALELINPRFYHLDTCFVPLSATSVMLCREAFTQEGFELIRELFDHIHLVPEQEAEQFFALNAHVLDLDKGRVALIQQGTTMTKRILAEEGYTVIELETSEFMKSGGSVFCMKMMYP